MAAQVTQVIVLAADTRLLDSLRAALGPAATLRIRHVRCPEALQAAAAVQDWLVLDLDSLGPQVLRQPQVARWPGQKLLVADAAKTPSQHASVTSAQAIARLRAALDPPQRRLTTLRAARRHRRHPAANRPASLEQLLTVAGSLNCLNRRQLIDLCVNDLPAALGLQLASFYQYDPKGRSLVLAQHNHGYPINDIVDVRRCPTQVMAWAARKRKPWLAEDLREQPPVRNGVVERPFADRYSTASCVIIPLQSRGRLVGVLNLADPLDDRPLRLKQIRPAVEAVAAILKNSLANIELVERLEQQARTDGLTGLANYRTFLEQLNKEVMRCRRYGTPLSLILLDVDGLKQVNDSRGHPAGDELLRTVAARVMGGIRETDVPARCGGDEFAIILPNTALPAARQVAQRIRNTIGQERLQWRGEPLTASISLGVGQYQGQLSVEEFVRGIDVALYTAKIGGKNRLVVSSPA